MTNVVFERRRWWLFVIVSALFFHITASTFTSLGVVIPFMIEDLSWSWTEAVFGFTVLSLFVVLCGGRPAWCQGKDAEGRPVRRSVGWRVRAKSTPAGNRPPARDADSGRGADLRREVTPCPTS